MQERVNLNNKEINRRAFLLFFMTFVFKFLKSNSAEAERMKIIPEYSEPPKWYKKEDLDFSVFPSELNFKPEKFLLAISRTWQNGVLYGPTGKRFLVGGQFLEILAGTGKVSSSNTETEEGVFTIERQNEGDYRSGKYYKSGGVTPRDREDEKAPMPWAQHIGRIRLNKGKLEQLPSDGTALHSGRTTGLDMLQPFRSHGCIRLQYKQAEFLRKLMKKGDFVVIFDDPEVLKSRSIKAMIEKVGKNIK